MDLRDYLRILRRSWLILVAATLLGLLVAGVASVVTPPTYTAQTRLFVAFSNSGTVQELQQGNTFSQSRVLSYVKTVDSPAVLQPVIDSLGLDTTPAVLGRSIKATSEPSTVLINISVADSSPVRAAAIAESTAGSLIRAVDNLEKPVDGGSSPIKLSVITPASAPSSPSAPVVSLNLILGLFAGLGLGLVFAFLRATLDTRIRGEADLRKVTDIPLLGAVTFDAKATAQPLLTQTSPTGPRAEAFRTLRTNLQFASVGGGDSKSVLVTSSVPGEGKSTTATNLAIALAEAGQAVCLVDADLRRPMVNDYLGLDRNAGLTTALLGVASVDDLLQPWGGDNLFVLTSGRIPPNPSELLGSEQMGAVISRLHEIFEVIVIDAPPLLPVTDAAVLSQHVGGVLLVVGSQKLRKQDLEKSLDALQLVEAKVLGALLNRVPAKGPDAYSYGYYSYKDDQRRMDDHGSSSDNRSDEPTTAALATSSARRFPYRDYLESNS